MENEIKPRKWLLVLLIIITIVIGAFLSYKGVLAIKKSIEEQKKNENKIKEEMNKKQDDIEEAMNKMKDEVEQKQKESQKNSFNRTFEFRAGSQYSASISLLLDDVIKNNKQNSDKLITVISGSTNTTDPDKIKDLKKSFEEWHKYEVSVDYNEDGYVNKITIEY